MARLEKVINRLREICGSERVITEPDKLIDYGHDEGPEKPHPPDVLVKACSAEEVSAVIQVAQSEKVPVTPRGLGTGLTGGSVPVCGGILISLELMNQIIEIDPDNLVVRTQPGVVTGQLQKACEDYGLYYPVDPASLDECSIGGNVATNAGGARAFRYGVTGDYLTGIEAVLANGSVIRYGGKIRKNATGYDLNKLLIGSEGTLAIITEITLRLIPKPKKSIDLLIPFPDLKKGVELVLTLVHHKRIIPTVVEFMERKGVAAVKKVLTTELPIPDAEVYLLVELEGNDSELVLSEAGEVGTLARDLGAGEPLVADNPSTQERLWQVRRSLAKNLKQVYSQVVAEDIVVPLAQVPATVDFIAQLEDKFGVVIVPFGHIGDGNIHVDICRTNQKDMEWQKTCEVVVDELVDFVIAVGGQITAEHGIGSLKRHLLKKGIGKAELALMKKLKTALDPKNILNPGKIFPESEKVDRRRIRIII